MSTSAHLAAIRARLAAQFVASYQEKHCATREVKKHAPADLDYLLVENDRLTAERDEAAAQADAFLRHAFYLEGRIKELKAELEAAQAPI